MSSKNPILHGERCEWPGCKNHSTLNAETPLILNESIHPEHKTSTKSCTYHAIILSSGRFGKMTYQSNSGELSELRGPFNDVKLIEHVIAAKAIAEIAKKESNNNEKKEKDKPAKNAQNKNT